jgi:hypothetical protein
MSFLLEKCAAREGRKLEYPHKQGGGDEQLDWQDVYVLMSEGGECLRQCFISLGSGHGGLSSGGW